MIKTEIEQDEFDATLGKTYHRRVNNIEMDVAPVLSFNEDDDTETVFLDGEVIAERAGPLFYKYTTE